MTDDELVVAELMEAKRKTDCHLCEHLRVSLEVNTCAAANKCVWRRPRQYLPTWCPQPFEECP